MTGNFWLGTAFSEDKLRTYLPENPTRNFGLQEYYWKSGVRPVIEIPTSAIELKSE